jgi:hypothetical protein
MAQFEPGHAKLGGRKPGSPARKISQLKSQLLNAARAAGTQISNDEKEPRRGGTTRYLKWLALKHPDLFCGLLKSCLPKEIESTITADVTGHAGAPRIDKPLDQLTDLELQDYLQRSEAHRLMIAKGTS